MQVRLLGRNEWAACVAGSRSISYTGAAMKERERGTSREPGREQETKKPETGKAPEQLRAERLDGVNMQLDSYEGPRNDHDLEMRIGVVRQQYKSATEGIQISDESMVRLDENMSAEVASLQERFGEWGKTHSDLQIEKIVLENSLEINPGQERMPVHEGAISEYSAVLATQKPDDSLGPLYIGKAEIEGMPLQIKTTQGMGRAAFIEGQMRLEDQSYNFLQWKGVDSPANRKIQQTLTEEGGEISYIHGKEDDFSPLMAIRFPGGNESIRFRGGSFYKYLLREAERSKQFEQFGLRMPKILKTIKFTREFCQEHNLPIPKNDGEGDLSGETLRDYLERQKGDISPELKDKLLLSYEANKHDQGFLLGQNVRAFRNVWRVDDVEKLIGDQDALEHIFTSSKKILSEETGQEISDKEFVESFSQQLGQQVAILLENRLVQGAMREHKQDITLAAEICDFDGAYEVDAFLADKSNEPKWLKDGHGTKEDWVKEQEMKLNRQILLVGAHMKPIVEAMGKMGRGQFSEEAVDQFVAGVVETMSEKRVKELKLFLEENQAKQETRYNKRMQNIEDIAGTSELALRNFAGYEDFFQKITGQLLEELKKRKTVIAK